MCLIKNSAGASLASEREGKLAECRAENEYLSAQMMQCLEENSRLMSENDTLNKGVSIVRNKVVPALECSICYDWVAKIPLILRCGHSFCGSCLIRTFQTPGLSRSCPYCRSKVSERPAYSHVFSSISGEISGEGEDSSEKARIQKELDCVFRVVS
ncbi:hypothetical protein IW261DRAFT_1503432 [Armillaria novae-zelandiae]|uniref:RING-type domain-containing protein n=1 Tax=Armillaria novae-zelandiae TaxID=153914 RepID=A0AA39NXN5_9AGAR|nr:hypothetical protein IW261DRAFT_1503432 [Armillaria novae-zelandiae]